MELTYLPNILSTLSALAPLILGALVWGRTEREIKIFIGFLVFGFVIDLLGWLNAFLQPMGSGFLKLRYFYWLVEPLFLIWFIRRYSGNRLIRNISAWLYPVFGISWLVSTIDITYLPIYKTATGIFILFLSAFLLLEMVENKQGERYPLAFWLVLGLFFYSFCTFFIMGLINSQAGLKIWWLQNAINIATNMVYGLGFWMARASGSEFGRVG